MLHLLYFTLIAQAVERRHYPSALVLHAWQFIRRRPRDGHDLRSILDVHTLTLCETIDHVTYRFILPRLAFRSRPHQHRTLAEVHGLQLLNFLRSLLVNPRHFRLQGRMLPIDRAQHRAVVANIVNGCLCIPEYRPLYVRQLFMQAEFCRHLMAGGIFRVGILHRALHILTYI